MVPVESLDINSIRVADARITEVVVRIERVVVRLCNWQENPLTLVFTEVGRVMAEELLGEDLSHIEAPPHDGSAGFRRFEFISASTNLPILSIVAKSCTIQSNDPTT